MEKSNEETKKFLDKIIERSEAIYQDCEQSLEKTNFFLSVLKNNAEEYLKIMMYVRENNKEYKGN